jgi:hypothetical protein
MRSRQFPPLRFQIEYAFLQPIDRDFPELSERSEEFGNRKRSTVPSLVNPKRLFTKLLSSLGLLMNPDTQTLAGTGEIGPTVFADLYFALSPTKEIHPLASSVFLTRKRIISYTIHGIVDSTRD